MAENSAVKGPIFLVGFMGSGKTTLGRAVAEELQVPFVDLDECIEEKERRSIRRIFDEGGEARFREIEAEILDSLTDRGKKGFFVIALGGGTPCRPGVMEKLSERGLTVYLEAPVDRIVERLLLEGDKRPLVAGKDEEEVKATVIAMMGKRMPYYSKASVTFDSSRLENEEQVKASVKAFMRLLESAYD